VKKCLLLLALLGGACLAPGRSAAEELGSHEVDEVVVSATRTERKTEDIPAAVSTVTKEELKDMRLLGVKEALTGMAGVQAETRNGGYDARLIIRGAGLKARYGIREIMILLDGVPITDPDGMTRLDFVDTQLIERVDVVRGPNSTLYGANAAGGVVNVITRNPFEEIRGLTLGYGSDDTRLYNLIYGTSVGQTYFTLSGTHKSTDGWRQWSRFETSQGGARIGHLFADGSTLEMNFNYTEADLQLPGSLSEEAFRADSTQLTSEPFRHSSRDSEIYSTGLKLKKDFGAIQLKPLVYYQHWQHLHPVTGMINDGGADVYGVDIQADLEHSFFGRKGLLTFGTAGQVDASEGDKFTYRDVATSPSGQILFTLSDAKGELAEFNDDTVSKWGVYAQESLTLSEPWLLDFGVRYDRVKFDLEAEIFQEFVFGANRYLPNRQSIEVDRSYDQISPRIGSVYKVTDWLHLYGNLSTGFQTPQSSELAENPDLDVARTRNIETGLKGRFPGGHRFDLAVFYMEVQDEIVQTVLEGGETSYSNAGETDKRGIELEMEVHPLPGLALGGTYTYSDFEFDEFLEPVRIFNPVSGTTETVLLDRGGNRLPYIPEHQYSVFGLYRHSSGFKCRIDANSWGEYWVDNANSEKYSGYDFLTNFMVGWENDRWNVTVDAYNVFDKLYAMEVTKSGETLAFRPGAPRTLFAKVSYQF